MLRVLIVDDHPIVRDGLSNLLRRSGLEVIGEAATADAAIELVDADPPDVVLLDLSMPGTDGTGAARRIRADHPDVAVVVLTAFADRDRVLRAVDAGVSGYLLKDDDPADLIRGIQAAAAGGSPFSPRVAGVLVESRANERTSGELTDREREVLDLVGEGLANKQIAKRLGISEGTVKAHLGRAFQRIGVRDRTQAALWVQRHRRS
jgi:DNA-binding NarL/FixJ family response regulator